MSAYQDTATQTASYRGMRQDPPPTVARHDLPPVKTILSAMLWLAAKHREAPTRETAHALVCQARWLVLHPDATREDILAGLDLACVTYHDTLLWMAAHANMGDATRH